MCCTSHGRSNDQKQVCTNATRCPSTLIRRMRIVRIRMLCPVTFALKKGAHTLGYVRGVRIRVKVGDIRKYETEADKEVSKKLIP